MGKRKKGPGKRRREPMTRRSSDGKRAAEAATPAGDDASAEDEAAVDDDDDDDDPVAGDDVADDAVDEAADEAGAGVSVDADDEASRSGDAAASAEDDEPDLETVLARGAPWGRPLARLERAWTWVEVRLLFAVLMGLICMLVAWVTLNGLASRVSSAGWMLRALVGVSVLALLWAGLTRWVLNAPSYSLLGRKLTRDRLLSLGMVLAVLLGGGLASSWRDVGTETAQRLQEWLAAGSVLQLAGGFQGMSSRLTITIALLGASLAAATGQHISVDVFARFVPVKLRVPVATLVGVATATVCFIASYGFMDFVAVVKYRADLHAPMSEKLAVVKNDLGTQLFFTRKQALLDVGTLGHVVDGGSWNQGRMTGREWNAWLDAEGFEAYYQPQRLAAIRASDRMLDEDRRPFLGEALPEGRDMKLLVPALDLVFPFGLLMIALRLLLRALLVLSGHVPPQLEHDEEAPSAAQPAQGEA